MLKLDSLGTQVGENQSQRWSLTGQEPELRVEPRKNLVSVIVFRRDDMVMCPRTGGENDNVGAVYRVGGALVQLRR